MRAPSLFCLSAFVGSLVLHSASYGLTSRADAPPLRAVDQRADTNAGGRLSGHVRDQEGRPAGATVHAFDVAEGAPSAGPRATTVTDSAGGFQLTGLPAGRYRLVARPSETRRVPGREPGTRIKYLTTFYPGVSTVGDAAIVVVAASASVRDIDITLAVTELVSIRGRVAGPPRGGVIVRLASSPAVLLWRLDVGADGTFFVTGLRPGRYLVSARADGRSGVETAFRGLDVVDDVEDLELALQPAGRLGGQVVTDTGGPLPVDGLRVAAVLMDGATDVDPLARDQVEVDAEGRFAIEGLFGDRRLRVIGLPGVWALDRVEHRGGRLATMSFGPATRLDDVRVVIGRVPMASPVQR